jgi:hypothetical protein
VPADLLRRVYDLATLGPTSVNCWPMRVVFRAVARGQGAAQGLPERGQCGEDDEGSAKGCESGKRVTQPIAPPAPATGPARLAYELRHPFTAM